MAKLENLCKTAKEVKKLLKEKYLNRKEFLGTDKFTFKDAIYDLMWIENLARYGEKDATYQELEPYFLADELTHKEVLGMESFQEHFKDILDKADDGKKDELIRCLKLMWKPSKKLGDYILLSTEVQDIFDDVWGKKDMSYEQAEKIADKAREDFYKEYNVTYWDLSKYEKRNTWEISRCKVPKPEINYRVVDSFNFNQKSDIIITDPCYISKWKDNINSSRSTIYGDWSCSVFECEKGKLPENGTKPFGQFCADSGQVCIENIKRCAQKEEILKWVNTHKWCATIIDNFVGTIEYRIKTDYYPKNAKWNPDESLIIYGYGKKDGKDFAFATCQTGF